MKHLQCIYLLTITLVSGGQSGDSDCCPKIKEEWCESECYKCDQNDLNAINKEQEEFDKFMDILYSFDALSMKMDIDNCTTGVRVPSHVEFNVDKVNTREQLYKQFYVKLSECNDCKLNSTPETFSKCSIRIRKSMARSIKGIIVFIETELEKLAQPHKDICDKLPISNK